MGGPPGLELRTSAVTGPEPCTCDLRELDLDERCSRCYLVAATSASLLNCQEEVPVETEKVVTHLAGSAQLLRPSLGSLVGDSMPAGNEIRDLSNQAVAVCVLVVSGVEHGVDLLDLNRQSTGAQTPRESAG